MSDQDKALDNLMAWQQEFEKQEPVAWLQMFRGDINNISLDRTDFQEWYDSSEYDYLPLYTAPRELSDEEIMEVINRTAWVGTEEEIRFKIARAILEKASEKC